MIKRELANIILDTSLSTTKRGNALEDHTIDYADVRGISLKKTKRSGALHGDGDLIMEFGNIVLDCKVKGMCKNININREELRKIARQAAKLDKHGAIITISIGDRPDDGHDETYITMPYESLIEILQTRQD